MDDSEPTPSRALFPSPLSTHTDVGALEWSDFLRRRVPRECIYLYVASQQRSGQCVCESLEGNRGAGACSEWLFAFQTTLTSARPIVTQIKGSMFAMQQLHQIKLWASLIAAKSTINNQPGLQIQQTRSTGFI